MNATQAKEISIVDYLAKQGITEQKQKGDNYFFSSPFRDEKKASFKVDNSLNLWYDYGLGSGGSIIDLVCKLNNTDVSGALQILGSNEIKKHKKPAKRFEKRKINYHYQDLQNKALKQYLEMHRKIPFELAKQYLGEVYYKDKKEQKHTHFALAFKNDAGGYELRNVFQKRSTGNYYTLIKGQKNTAVNVFEGFMDFLSALVYFKQQKTGFDTLVLNSIANKSNALEVLGNYKKINLFLDNDSPGVATNQFFKEQLPNAQFTDYSAKIYPNAKDFNNYLIAKSKLANSELKVIDWVNSQMQFEKWYTCTNDQKKQLLSLMTEKHIINCEFNNDYSKYRKVQLDYSLTGIYA